MRLDWLADELRAAGLTVVEHDGWETRTNQPFDGYHPVGLIDHHTAGSSILTDYPNPPYWSNRRLEASCNITIRGDGTVCVLNAGWAHDSGNGDKKVLAEVRADRPAPRPTDTYIDGKPGGTNPGVSGNRYFIDIEVQHLGNGDPIHPLQRQALITTNAVICGHMGWDPRYRLIGHRGWTRRKVDPRWDGSVDPMPQIRRDTLSTMEGVITRQSKADDGLDTLAANFQELKDVGVFTTHTQAGGITFNDEFATFLLKFEAYIVGKYGLGHTHADSGGLTQADADAQIATHAANPDAHHA